jgi:predicted O-methyltransferase YrrM
MTAAELLKDIFREGQVQDKQGNKYPLRAGVDEREGNFLKELIEQYRPMNTIEIGCANGISSLYICSALEKYKGARHTIVDPGQTAVWKNIGIQNLRKANIDFFELIEKPSELALPELLAQKKKFDFCFIDGWHTLDHTLIDFFYLNRLMAPGSIVVIDDITLPAINKLIRYILNYDSFRLLKSVAHPLSWRKKLFGLLVEQPFRLVSFLVPQKFRYRIFSGNIIRSDKKLQLNSSMIALTKTSEDTRSWNWYKDF